MYQNDGLCGGSCRNGGRVDVVEFLAVFLWKC